MFRKEFEHFQTPSKRTKEIFLMMNYELERNKMEGSQEVGTGEAWGRNGFT